MLGVVWSIEHFKNYFYGNYFYGNFYGNFTVITDHRALLSIMRKNRTNKSYNSRRTSWVNRLLLFDFTIDHLPGSKMGLVDYISRDPQQKAVNISAYDEQFTVAKLDVIKRGAKRFFLNTENYIDFAERNALLKQASNTPNSINKLGKEFAPRNPENSAITEYDNTISKLAPNNPNSNIQIETTNIPHSLFALNCSTKQLPNKMNNFQRIANKFQSVLMMSNSDDETLMQVKHSTPSKVRFADEAGPSTAPAVQATPSIPNTDTTTVTSPSTDDLYTDAFSFALYKVFSSTLMANLTTKDAILKEIRDCILTENEDRFNSISPYIHTFWKDMHVKNGCVCIDDRIAIPNSIKEAYVGAIHATHPGRQLGNDRHGDTCMVAIHASGHNIKNSKVQSLCQNR